MTADSQLRDSLNTGVQGFQLLSEEAIRHTPTQVPHQKSCKAVLWEREGVENQHRLSFQGTSAN